MASMHHTVTPQINILMNRYNPSSHFNSPESSFRTPKLNAGPVDTPYLRISRSSWPRHGGTYTKIWSIQRRLTWPLRKDDMQTHEVLHHFRGGRGLMYGVLDLWPGGVGLSLCSGKTVLGWGGTLGRGAEPPTALRVPHRQLPTALGVGALGWVECREQIFCCWLYSV